jgi:hypothetical protein
MSYIGNKPALNYTSFAVQHFTTSATTGYTLDHAVTNENDIRLVINNVVQQPGGSYAYTAAGTVLTLSAATAGTDTMYCVFLGKAVQTVNPGAGSVGTSQIANSAVDLTAKVTGTLPIANGGTGSTSTTFVNATTNITGVLPTANLGSGTASSSTVLYGDQTYKAEPSGGLVHIKTITASSSSSITFLDGTSDVVLDSTYDTYLFIGTKIDLSSDDDSVRVSFSVDEGSNYNSQTYRGTSTIEVNTSGSASSGTEGQASAGASSLMGAAGNGSSEGQYFQMYLYNPASTTQKKSALAFVNEEQHNLIWKLKSTIISIAEASNAIDGVRFNCNAGNFTTGDFRLYGVTNG